MAELHLNDIGTVIRVRIIDEATDAALDVSDATTKQIIFKKPDNVSVTKTAVFTTDGSDGYIQYVTVADDLDVAGTWKVQGKVVSGLYTNSSEIKRLEIRGNL